MSRHRILTCFIVLLHLLLIISSSSAATSDSCHPCKCLISQDLLEVDCNNRGLTSVPSFNQTTRTRIQTLNIGRNRLKTLAPNSFEDMVNLTTLNLNENNIINLPSYLFVSLKNLRVLDLSGNNLSFIQEETFQGLARLQYLDLSLNPLSVIHVHAFRGLNDLQDLKMRRNDLTSIPSALWHTDLPNATIDMQGNTFNCSCESKHLVEILRRKFHEVQITPMNCSIVLTSSYCQDYINHAIATNVTLIGIQDDQALNQHIRNVNDNDMNTNLTFPNQVSNQSIIQRSAPKNTSIFLEIHFEAATVVRQVLVYGSSSLAGSTILVVGDEGDKVCGHCSSITSNVSDWCEVLETFQPPCNVSCSKLMYGSSIRILFELNEDYHNCSPKYHQKTIREVKVFGYEKDVYNLWGSWSRWSVCTKTCDGGTSHRYRYCNNPTSLQCPINRSNTRGLYQRQSRSCGTKDCPEGIWFGIIGGLAGIFILGLIGILYRGMEFKTVQRRPKYSVSEIWNSNGGYANDEQGVESTEC